jgi:hypothetical protein
MRRNPAMELDFARRGGSVSRFGVLLLVTGVIAAGGTIVAQRSISGEVAARETELEQLRSLSRRSLAAIDAREADSPELRDQIKRANEVLAQLNLPWASVFAAVESAQDPSVALLAVVPDPRARTVQIIGQGRDLAAILNYMRRLQDARLQDVVLATHEAKLKEPGQPVEFTLLARWMDRR